MSRLVHLANSIVASASLPAYPLNLEFSGRSRQLSARYSNRSLVWSMWSSFEHVRSACAGISADSTYRHTGTSIYGVCYFLVRRIANRGELMSS